MKKLFLFSALFLAAVSGARADVGFRVRIGEGYHHRQPVAPPVVVVPRQVYQPPLEIIAPQPPYRHVLYERYPGWHYCFADHRWEPIYQSCYFLGYRQIFHAFPQVVYETDPRVICDHERFSRY